MSLESAARAGNRREIDRNRCTEMRDHVGRNGVRGSCGHCGVDNIHE